MAPALIAQCRAAAAPEAFLIYEQMKAFDSCSVAEGLINHLYAGCPGQMMSDQP